VTVNGVSAVVGGDAIVSFDGKPIASADELAAAVAAHRPGDRITLGTIRKGHERTVNATLANAPRNAT
jgi:S1-C subfamily serine protease